MLSSDKFLSLLKRKHLVLSSPKWTDSLLSINQSHTFANTLFEIFSISVTYLCWQKILVSSAYRYVWVFDRACGVSFIYSKNNKGLNIDPWGTRQFMVPVSQKTVSNETKKAPFVRKEWNHFIVLLEKPIDFISSNKIL